MSAFQDLIRRSLIDLGHPDFYENYRPVWMQGLELDFYYPDQKLAFEVQGDQHNRFTPKFHACIEDFVAQQDRDKRKKHLCKSRGIELVYLNQNDTGLRGLIEGKVKRFIRGPGHNRHITRPLRDEFTSMIKVLTAMCGRGIKKGRRVPLKKKQGHVHLG